LVKEKKNAAEKVDETCALEGSDGEPVGPPTSH